MSRVDRNILDIIITVPLFVKSYGDFYGNWMMWVGFALFIVLTVFAGFEFDSTYTHKIEGDKKEDKENNGK